MNKKLYWNHRVMKRTFDNGEVFYELHEVYYNEKDEVEGFTDEPIKVMEETPEELKTTLERLMLALDKPVLDYNKLASKNFAGVKNKKKARKK